MFSRLEPVTKEKEMLVFQVGRLRPHSSVIVYFMFKFEKHNPWNETAAFNEHNWTFSHALTFNTHNDHRDYPCTQRIYSIHYAHTLILEQWRGVCVQPLEWG